MFFPQIPMDATQLGLVFRIALCEAESVDQESSATAALNLVAVAWSWVAVAWNSVVVARSSVVVVATVTHLRGMVPVARLA